MNIQIPSAYIIDYLTKNLSLNSRVSSGGKEFVTESLFVENDIARHLSINLYTGLWRCFKSGETGNFFKLVSIIEEIPYDKAVSLTLFRSFDYEKDDKVISSSSSSQKSLDIDKLIPVRAQSYSVDEEPILKAWNYLYSRKLFDVQNDKRTYYISEEDYLQDRIIIPFELDNGKFVYYQARALSPETKPKYISPSFDNPLLKSHNLLFPFDWSDTYVVVVEGPLDAISLQLQGINATAIMGSYVSLEQAHQLRDSGCEIILGFDNDDAGRRCIQTFDKTRDSLIMPPFKVANIPAGYKDWNAAHAASVKFNKDAILNSNIYDFKYKINQGLRTI